MIQLLKTKTHSESETYEFARSIAKYINNGAILILNGKMGVGKSVFARGIINELGYTGAVTSPTFTLMNEYPTEPAVYHFDLYRLEYPEELFDIGYDECMYSDNISIIEWAERMGSLFPNEYVLIEIARLSENNRDITVSTNSEKMLTAPRQVNLI